MEISIGWVAVCLLLFSPLVSATDSKNNPADQLVAAVNDNRTSIKLPALLDNAGLGCLALEYIKAYQGQCNEVGQNKKPLESSFVDTFAPNCGVEAQTLAPISGRLLGCQSNYVPPDQAFDILIKNAGSLEIVHNKNHTQVGAAVSGTDGGGPYFWCLLFSNGKGNNSFSFQGGVAKVIRPGCFSGNDDDCSSAVGLGGGVWSMVAGVLIAAACAFGL